MPVVDGTTLPAHPFEPAASPLSAAIPILTGSNECEAVPYGNPSDAYWTSEPTSDGELRAALERIVAVDDADADRLIALYRSNRPLATPGDLAAIMAGDNSMLRQSSYTIAARKFAQGAAPVYLYYFDWYSPVRDGKLRAMHGMELPFVFAHPDLVQFMTGMGDERYELARKMSAAWAAFARTGNPNHGEHSALGAVEPDALADDAVRPRRARRRRPVGRGAARHGGRERRRDTLMRYCPDVPLDD